MSVADEITRLNGAKNSIIQALTNKGVTVPASARLDDMGALISSIPSSGSFDAANVVTIVPIDKIVVVDSNGYIGFDLTGLLLEMKNIYYYGYAILSPGDDFSGKGLGRVTFYTPSTSNIGGRVYNTVVIGEQEWLAENLDFKFRGLAFRNASGYGSSPTDEPFALYYANDEATYGLNGNKYGLLYNWAAVKYLEMHKTEFIPGWHVATSAEWTTLAAAVGGAETAGIKLKSTTGWDSSGNGDGSTSFSACPAGGFASSMHGVGKDGICWTLTAYDDFWAYIAKMSYNSAELTVSPSGRKEYCYSLRLVRDT